MKAKVKTKGQMTVKNFNEYKEECFEKMKHCRDAFMALGDENRQKIIRTVFENGIGGMRVGDITAAMKLSRPAVSHHLKILKSAKLINVRRVGTKNYYYVDKAAEIWKQIGELAAEISAVVSNDDTNLSLSF